MHKERQVLIQGEGGGNTPGTSRDNQTIGSVGLGHNAGNVKHLLMQQVQVQLKGYNQWFKVADGGRAGYFFGGRVNFKNGGLASIL